LHALCRFFVERSGSGYEIGARTMLPFLVDMARLYDLFVAEWLTANPPENGFVKPQESLHLDDSGSLHFDIDLVLYDAATSEALCFMDTKYKSASASAAKDLA
jgi:5-methylcytosine-specific restriction enzyme subunit McrC